MFQEMVKTTKRLRPLLGTFVEIGVTTDSSTAYIEITNSFNLIEKVQNLLSFHNPDSDLSLLNQNPGTETYLQPITIRVLRLAQIMTKQSRGLFNFTCGGALVQRGVLPMHNRGQSLIFGDETDLLINGKKAMLKRPVLITLDGIAKGYAVDLAVRYLMQSGFDGGWVNAGGDLRVFGTQKLPVHVRGLNQELNEIGVFQNTSIATSVIQTQKCLRFPGEIVSSQKDTLSPGTWTVKASYAWKADALTKVAGVSPAQERRKIVESFGGELLVNRMDVQ